VEEKYPMRPRNVWLTLGFVWLGSVLGLGLDFETGACLFYMAVGAGCLYVVYGKRD